MKVDYLPLRLPPSQCLAQLPQFRQFHDFFEAFLSAVAPRNKRAVVCFHHGVAAACLRRREKPM
jgi:hypothetical protein